MKQDQGRISLVATAIAMMLAGGMIMSACNDNENTPSQQAALSGTWEWVSTDGGIAYHIHETPASTGKSVELIFGDGYTYRIQTNGVITSEGTYSLEPADESPERQRIQFSNDLPLIIDNVDLRDLFLTDGYADGVGMHYRRKGAAHRLAE